MRFESKSIRFHLQQIETTQRITAFSSVGLFLSAGKYFVFVELACHIKFTVL